MKTGLVLEGGAMRGMYTAGVLDVFMEQEITFDGVIGVSAGALFGVNLLSKQAGRVIRYNKRFNADPNYLGLRPLLRTGNIVDTEYAFDRVPRTLDVFDDETYRASGVPFYAVVTNVETGEPEYIKIDSVFDQMDVLRASGSMPFVSKPVEIGGKKYLDGAITDSIPFEKFMEMGYDRLVVVLTKPAGYVKKPMSPLLTRMFYENAYPKFAERVCDRHEMYNSSIERLAELEKKGTVLVLRPSQHVKISRVEKNPDKLQALYEVGIRDAQTKQEQIRQFLAGTENEK
ncbi:MAG: patatin family protein [Eubacterium sp.]|nr:patatin family protein [Eubacterium sp.]